MSTRSSTISIRLEPGDGAPAFTLPDQHGNAVDLRDADGRDTLLYFYAEAGTPACTQQACDFRDNLGEFEDAGYRVLGVSRDGVEKLAGFAEQNALTFPVLSDPDLAVHEAYGTWGEKSLYGKTVTGVIRATFVIAPDGVIRFAAYNIKATNHVRMLRTKLKV